MKMVFVWFFLSCKRYLKKPGILLALLLLPVTAWIAGKYIHPENEGIKIALYLQETAGENVDLSENGEQKNGSGEYDPEQNWKNMGIQLVKDLLNSSVKEVDNTNGASAESESLFWFYLCDSEEQLKAHVASEKAECGYVVPEDLGERLRNKKIKNTITLYTSPSTVTGSLSTESIFAALARLYDRQILVDHMQDEATGDLYDTWYANGNIFHFEYVYGDIQIDADHVRTKSANNIFPVKGINAVIIFIMSLYSACILKEDEKKGLFSTLHSGEKQSCQIVMFLALPVLSFISGILALFFAGILKSGISGIFQIAELILYTTAAGVYAWILKLLVRSSSILLCLIPFFLMGSLIFTPVFVDIGRFVPSIGWIGRLFLPYYFLH